MNAQPTRRRLNLLRTLPPIHEARPWYHERRVWGAVVAAVLLISLVGVTTRQSGSTPLPTAPAAQYAPLPLLPAVGHGTVRPLHSARVATQTGGVVQTLWAAEGAPVRAQQEIAMVQTAAGTEVLVAPFTGTIMTVPIRQGDTLPPGATVASLGDLSRYLIDAVDVDEYLVAQLHGGQEVAVTIEALGSGSNVAVIDSIGLEPTAASAGLKTYPVTVSLLQAPAGLKTGMTARLVFLP